MTPMDLIGWALAIGLAWAILASFIPLESWIAALISHAKRRQKERPSGSPDAPSDPPSD